MLLIFNFVRWLKTNLRNPLTYFIAGPNERLVDLSASEIK